ncbi:PREDICTED: uncharacterized protein LOC106746670 [Dinoponera quadriceps]|uniref:Uncharacterized protein LOC106746670 n=1 Tax=Dinoponera quadriceps TaxID=609295 RepID=A0A6P3XLZ1_DINQU|nr:PREDICTED: uncharacterized protein LOC106746670 [Dinoponera quadriceps]
MIITYVVHVCGMFRIASYRIQRALSSDVLRKIGPKEGIKIHKEIIYAVDIHRKAMKYCELLLSSFEGMNMFLIVFGVLSLSLNLFRVFQIMSFGGDIDEFCMHFTYAFIDIVYMFLANYAAQEITNHNDHVFVTTYHVQWYAAPLHIQRMILFLLQRGTKTFTITIGGLLIGSMESFTSLISVSLSYFTVIYSTQN